MRILLLTGCLIGAIASPTVGRAQKVFDPDQTPPPQQATGTVRPGAPMSRRQPRPVDLPERASTIDPDAGSAGALDDEALQRKISGICRGC